MTRPLLALLLAGALVLAGCGSGPVTDTTAPTTGQPDAATGTTTATTGTGTTSGATTPAERTTTPTATTSTAERPAVDGPVATEGFDPDYDAAQVLARVERLRGVNSSAPIVVEDEGLSRVVARNLTMTPSESFFSLSAPAVRALQYASSEERVPVASPGSAREGRRITVLAADPLRERYGLSQEVILAHEYVHVLQRDAGVYDVPVDGNTTDGWFTTTAVVEGDALVVEEQYRTRYTDAEGGRYFSVAARNETRSRSRWLLGLANAAYYEGYRYYVRSTDEPAERSAVMRDPPGTTAEVLHPDLTADVPGASVPAPTVEGYEVTKRDRLGELPIRYALRLNGVPYHEASAAADGWRNDTVVTYTNGSREGVYWGTRFANASEAAAFADAWRGMLADRNATTNGSLVTVPATGTTPEMHYVVVTDGSTVKVAAADSPATARVIAEGFPRAEGSS